jgi:hypothetical protein
MRTLLTVLILAALTGCASLAPTDLLLEQDHMSSATQHLRAHPTNMGVNASMVYLRWRPTKHTYVDLGEGVSYSASFCPHHPEVFQGRVGIDIPLRGE